MARETGKIVYYDVRKGFGKIAPDTGGEDVFVHVSNIAAKEAWALAIGEPVEYERRNTDQGPNAFDLTRLEDRCTGVVEHFDKGYGSIQPDGGGDPIFVHYSDIATAVAFKTLDEGQEVDFATERAHDGRVKAVRVIPDMRTPLERFAVLPKFDEQLEQLKILAQDEEGEWEYINRASTTRLPVLRNYVNYTFRRLQEEEKIAYTPNPKQGGQLACFNTGLVTDFFEPVFAVLFENTRKPELTQRFVLWGFFQESDYPVTEFARRPDMANYFTDPADLVYDRRRELVRNVDHIVNDRISRFPEEFQHDKSRLVGALDIAIARAEQRVLRNYKTAIPQYNRGRIQLLLPICLTDPRHADVALVVGREGAVYKGYTVLGLEMAYNNARLITRPDREWLKP